MKKKTLYKNKNAKKVCGVCAGLSEYFEIDVTIIRLLWAISILFFGTGLLIYFITALILPNKETVASDLKDNVQEVEYKEI